MECHGISITMDTIIFIEVILVNYQLEMNYIKSEIRHVIALNTCIGAGNPQEFGWIVNNINDFRMQSIELYQKILDVFLTKTGMKLYVFEFYQNTHQHTLFQEIPINNVNLSFLNQCNKFIVILSKYEPSSLQFFENQDMLFETMYKKGYALFEINDYFTEGNSMTFYCRNCEVLSQLEEIARTIGFAKVV